MGHEIMREILVRFSKDIETVLRPHIYVAENFDEHVARMKFPRQWGTALELLAAASLMWT